MGLVYDGKKSEKERYMMKQMMKRLLSVLLIAMLCLTGALAEGSGIRIAITACLIEQVTDTEVLVHLLLALMGTLVICGVQGLDLVDGLFETFSAIGTVGMTTGITRDLNTVSRLIVIFLMYCGRVGSISFGCAFVAGKNLSGLF